MEGPARHKNLHRLPNTKLVAVSNANLVFSIYLLPWFIWVKFILLGFIFTFTFCNKSKLVCFSLVSTFCQSMPTWEISVKISTSTKIYAFFVTFKSQNMSMNRAVQWGHSDRAKSIWKMVIVSFSETMSIKEV